MKTIIMNTTIPLLFNSEDEMVNYMVQNNFKPKQLNEKVGYFYQISE